MHDKSLRITVMAAISAGLSVAMVMLPFAIYALLRALFFSKTPEPPILSAIILGSELFLWVIAPLISYWAACDFYFYFDKQKSKKQKKSSSIKIIAAIAAIIGMVIGYLIISRLFLLPAVRI